MDVSIERMEELLKKLESLGLNIEDVMKKSIEREAKRVQGDAKALCPVDLGDLRNSIQTKSKIEGGKITGTVFTNSDHAVYVEFGTGRKGETTPVANKYLGPISYKQDKWLVNIPDVGPRWIEGQPAQPYLYPALKNNEKKIMDNIKKDIKKIIREVVNK